MYNVRLKSTVTERRPPVRFTHRFENPIQPSQTLCVKDLVFCHGTSSGSSSWTSVFRLSIFAVFYFCFTFLGRLEETRQTHLEQSIDKLFFKSRSDGRRLSLRALCVCGFCLFFIETTVFSISYSLKLFSCQSRIHLEMKKTTVV